MMTAHANGAAYDDRVLVPPATMTHAMSRSLSEDRSAAEMLIDEIIDAAADDPRRSVSRWLRIWETRTQAELPPPGEIRALFAQTLTEESDLSTQQVEEFTSWLFPVEKRWRESSEECLLNASERFHSMVRPWFPVWQAYISWTLNWCVGHGYTQIGFLCRDAVPFYVIGNRQAGGLGEGTTSLPLNLRLLHASRRLMRSPNFDKHSTRAIPNTGQIAFVDSGCYGSLIPERTKRSKNGDDSRSPAVFFYFSRNPQIFGYVNYLAIWEMLAGRWPGAVDRSLADFIILAGDVIEALPKPYTITDLSAAGEPLLRLQDAATFVLGARLVAELDRISRGPIDPRRQRDEAHAAFLSLWAMFASSRVGELTPGLPFRTPAPKNIPTSDAYRHLRNIPPQEMMFGTSAG